MAMTTNPSEIGETARLWAIRAGDPSFDDWDGFTAWLERDPAHLAAYEAALEDERWAEDAFAAESPAVPAPANDQDYADDRDYLVPPMRSRGRWLGIGGAIAAGLALVAGWAVLDRGPALQQIATAVGEHKTVELADGSRITLNSGTQVALDPEKPRYVELARGEALFEVRHDDRNPFVVIASGTRLLDAGTVFNVIGDGQSLDVSVSHGAVIYEPGKQAIRLNEGDALSRADGEAQPVVHKTNPQAVGSWQAGILQYDDAPLDRVASDLGRNIGRPLRAADGSEKRRFTGTLVVSGSPDQVLARAGPLLGVRFEAEGTAWKMTLADGERP